MAQKLPMLTIYDVDSISTVNQGLDIIQKLLKELKEIVTVHGVNSPEKRKNVAENVTYMKRVYERVDVLYMQAVGERK